MAGETVITVVGNLTSDPELRFTPNGACSRELHRGLDAAYLRPSVERVQGRGDPVPAAARSGVRWERTSPNRRSGVPGSSCRAD